MTNSIFHCEKWKLKHVVLALATTSHGLVWIWENFFQGIVWKQQQQKKYISLDYLKSYMYFLQVSKLQVASKSYTVLHYMDTDVETQHNRDVMLGNEHFSVSVRGWKQMTESFAREHFAHRIKIGWLGLNLSKEQTQIPHSQTLYGSHLRCLWAVVEGDISLSCHLLQKPFSTSTGLWRICRAE